MIPSPSQRASGLFKIMRYALHRYQVAYASSHVVQSSELLKSMLSFFFLFFLVTLAKGRQGEHPSLRETLGKGRWHTGGNIKKLNLCDLRITESEVSFSAFPIGERGM